MNFLARWDVLSLLGTAMGTDLACSFRKCGCCSGALHLIPGARSDGALCLPVLVGPVAVQGVGFCSFCCTESHDSALGGRSCSIHWALYRWSWAGFPQWAQYRGGAGSHLPLALWASSVKQLFCHPVPLRNEKVKACRLVTRYLLFMLL